MCPIARNGRRLDDHVCDGRSWPAAVCRKSPDYVGATRCTWRVTIEPRVRVPEEDSRAFTEIAIGVRTTWHVFNHCPHPVPGSAFAQTHELYPFEPLAERAQAYVRAALEHLVWWADWVAPLKFHPEQEVNFSLRPAYTLGRAGLESAAQAVWMLETTSPLECIRRHICLMRWDLQEHRKSKLEQAAKDVIKVREADLVHRVSEVFSDDEVRAPDGYLAVIRAAAGSAQLELQPDDTERLWRAASGVAHGKYWPTQDLQRPAFAENPDGTPTDRAIFIPDTKAMAELVNSAFRMTQFAALRYADYCGANLVTLHEDALNDVAEALPLREGVDPAWKDLMFAGLTARLEEMAAAE